MRRALPLILATIFAPVCSCTALGGLDAGTPSPVTDLRIVSKSVSSVMLQWTQGDNGVKQPARYIVAFGTPTVPFPIDASKAIEVAGTSIGSSNTAVVEGLQRGTQYEFRVVAFRGSLDSAATFGEVSSPVVVTTDVEQPEDVTDASAVALGQSSISLQWRQVADGAGQPANYLIAQGSPTVDWVSAQATAVEVVGSQVGSLASYTFSSLPASTTFQFQIASIRGRKGSNPVVGNPSSVLSATTQSASATTPFFTENFDNGARTNANGFVWGSGTRVNVSNERSFSGSYSLRFRYGPDTAGQDSHSEQRFDMGRYLPEYWVDFMLYVPANFVHRSESPNNNKFFVTWRDTYSDNAGGTWRIGYEYRGNGQLRPMSSRWDYNIWTNVGLNHPQLDAPFIGGTGPVLLGQWNRIRMQFKAASSRSASDGVMRMWVNDALFAELTNGKFHNFYDTPVDAALRNGYFLGWSNSGFTQETLLFIDDVKFYSTNPGW